MYIVHADRQEEEGQEGQEGQEHQSGNDKRRQTFTTRCVLNSSKIVPSVEASL